MLTRQEFNDYMEHAIKETKKTFVGTEGETFTMPFVCVLIGRLLADLDFKYTEKKDDERN